MVMSVNTNLKKSGNISICVDGDTVLFHGEDSIVKEKYTRLLERFNDVGLRSDSVRIIPLYKRLSEEDCQYVIDVAFAYTQSGFVKKLIEVFETDDLYRWLSDEKAYKVV